MLKTSLRVMILKLLDIKLCRNFFDFIIQSIFHKNEVIYYNNTEINFSSPNYLTSWRYNTFATKEPETLKWIDSMEPNSTFWDIGANVGLYSIYAAKSKKSKVVSFEPSVFNLEILARNVELNNLTSLVCIFPLPLSNMSDKNIMHFTTTQWGGALSTFGEDIGPDGESINEVFGYQTYGITMDDVSHHLNLGNPDYIKIDVDGIEHLILSAGLNVLKNVKEVLIEINDDFTYQSTICNKILINSGLKLKRKDSADVISNNSASNVFNQVWSRD